MLPEDNPADEIGQADYLAGMYADPDCQDCHGTGTLVNEITGATYFCPCVMG